MFSALEAVQPVDLTASEISVQVGRNMAASGNHSRSSCLNCSAPHATARWNIHVHYAQYTGEWNVEGKSYDRSNVKAHNTYGTEQS